MEMRTVLGTLAVCSLALVGCKDAPGEVSQAAESPKQSPAKAGAVENIDAKERAAAAELRPAKDPVIEEVYAFLLKTRQLFNNRDFDALEKLAADLRGARPTFGNGAWKIVQFYQALDLNDDEPESMWEQHAQIYRDWIAAKPQSISARIAQAEYLTSYAWLARGSGYAGTVKEEGWKLFGERLNEAQRTLTEARALPDKDPMWWFAAMTLALGQGWPKPQYDALVAEATAFEPQFWEYDNKRAYSLLPRWYGEPGDWEAYAEAASSRPGGLGAEAYARIVINLRGHHSDIFRESKASWPKTREGLEMMRKKYPESLEIVSNSAMLAVMAGDRELAKEMFNQLDGKYLPMVWRKPERFVHYRTWVETGKW